MSADGDYRVVAAAAAAAAKGLKTDRITHKMCTRARICTDVRVRIRHGRETGARVLPVGFVRPEVGHHVPAGSLAVNRRWPSPVLFDRGPTIPCD